MKNRNNTPDGDEGKGLAAAMLELPGPLATKFQKYIWTAVAFFVLIIVMLFVGKSVTYLWGMIFPVYFAYLALSLVWGWAEGKILCRKMRCIKSQRRLREQLFLIMQTQDAPKGQEEEIFKFHIPVAKKEAELFTENTLLKVYYDPAQTGEMIAWEIIGNQ